MSIVFRLALFAALLALPAQAQSFRIDFGDDASEWSDDGECDDPRFEGPAMHAILLLEDAGHDATDCRALFDAGRISLRADVFPPPPGYCGSITFGDNTSDWPDDDECDDPRFEGMAVGALAANVAPGHDANDCRRACALGMVRLIGGDEVTPESGTSRLGRDK